VKLAPGEATQQRLSVDPRLLATFDAKQNAWIVAAGTYRVHLGASAADLKLEKTVSLTGRTLPVGQH
jgi:beta-glucosidase